MFSAKPTNSAILDECNVSSEELIELCREALSRIPKIKLAIVYGSVVTGRMRSKSDIDVAVLCEDALNIDERSSLIDCLSSVCRREIDLVDLYGLDGEILRQILCKGRILIKKDGAAYYHLARRMIYNEADFMPLVRRAQKEQIRKFING